MKILISVDPEIPVPPALYGGIERVVHQLGAGYTELGHETALIAHPQSESENFTSIYRWPALKSRGTKEVVSNGLALRNVVRRERPDLIHSFSRIAYLPFIWDQEIDIIQTFQRKISNRTTTAAKQLFNERLHLTACGAHMYQSLKGRDTWTAVPNCCDTSYLSNQDEKDRSYLAFLGRIEPIKGVLEAIQYAHAVKTPLVIAGNVEAEWTRFFEKEVKPHIDGDFIKFIGTVDDAAKRELLSGAIGFLMLIQWEEPFGIVMAEALACGAPVIALNRGSVPEIVKHGVNGIIGNNLEELIDAFPIVPSIKPHECQKDALNRFSIRAVASAYLDVLNH